MKNETLERLVENYKLSEKEHKIILDELKTNVFSDKIPQKKPSVMFVIGQPGCGKTTFIQSLDLSDYTIINSDNYRHLSKYSDEILNKYPIYYAKFTNFDAHLWGDELFSYAINNGYSVLREKAPVDYNLLELIKMISNNYDVVVNIVVTGNLQSLLATRERYEKDIQKKGDGKLSNIESHNKCYNLLPDFISKCLYFGIKVNYVVPANNVFKIISVGNDYLNLFEKLRKESNEQACLNYKVRMNNIKKAMIKRNASQEQFDELNKIENIYFKLVNSEKTESIKLE